MVAQTLTQSQVLNLELERKWNKKLRKSRSLAPKDMQSRMSKETYNTFCQEFDIFVSNYIEQELNLLAQSFSIDQIEDDVVSVVGVGLARGLGFIPKANAMGMKVNLYDISDEALKRGTQVLCSKGNSKFCNVNSTHKVEITGSEGEISLDSRLIVMSQFLQILPEQLMQEVMARMAQHMILKNSRIIIVHPFENGNNVVWGDTIEYSLDEIVSPLQIALLKYDQNVITVREADIMYFNRHHYKAFTLQLDE